MGGIFISEIERGTERERESIEKSIDEEKRMGFKREKYDMRKKKKKGKTTNGK